MQEVKSIDVMPLVKMKAIFGIVIGLVYGVIFGIFSAYIGLAKGITWLEVFRVALMVIAPIIFGIIAFIRGAVVALLYNFFAEKVGGIQLNLVQK